MYNKDYTVLLVDDDLDGLTKSAALLKKMGYKVCTASDGTRALELLVLKKPPIILTDLRMPMMDGIELLNRAREIDQDVVVVIYTGYASIPTAVKAVQDGAFDYIAKPFGSSELKIVLDRAFKYSELALENRALRTQVEQNFGEEGILGKSSAMKRIMLMVRKAARTNSNVLITGESGTGKEQIARSIHHLSSRGKKSFVAVNSAALPDNLLEAELFGYEKGAFTGAIRLKHGLCEIAHEGTLFLDEIGEMPLPLQVKLLSVLQNRKFRRVGGTIDIEADFRIISATNIDVENAVKIGHLREDLYYRLNVIRIHMPPLRDRKEDITLLTYHFIKKYAANAAVDVKNISDRALLALKSHDWPGNVRELENAVEHAISMAESEIIEVTDLPTTFHKHQVPRLTNFNKKLRYKEAKKEILCDFTRQYLTSCLIEMDGNISRVAKAAGLNRKTIYRMIDDYNIDRKLMKDDGTNLL